MEELLAYINTISPIKEETFNELQKSFKPLQLKMVYTVFVLPKPCQSTPLVSPYRTPNS